MASTSSTTTTTTVVTFSTIGSTTTTEDPNVFLTTTTAAPSNTTVVEQDQWQFLLSAFIVMVIATTLCGTIIWVCKSQTKEAREKREKEEEEKENERKRFEEELKMKDIEEEKLREEKEELIRRELEEQDEIEQARKEGREVDPVYTKDDIFYANINDVPTVVEHPSTLVESGTQALDHKGMPKPRSGDKSYSKAKTTDAENGMVNEKLRTAPNVMGMRVINGVDFYRNQYEKTIAQQQAREQADRIDQARKNSQPYSYRQLLKNKRKAADDDGVGLGEDFASGMDGGGDDAHRGGINSAISQLPWLGKQNLSAFDGDAFEKAFADLPDDDEQEEMDKKKLLSATDHGSAIHARVTGQVLVRDENDDDITNERPVAESEFRAVSSSDQQQQAAEKKKFKSRTDGGGGASMFSLLEAPAARKVREEAEAIARRNDQIERQKYAKLVDQASKPRKKGQPRVVLPPEPPKTNQRVLVVNPNLKEDKEAYYAQLL